MRRLYAGNQMFSLRSCSQSVPEPTSTHVKARESLYTVSLTYAETNSGSSEAPDSTLLLICSSYFYSSLFQRLDFSHTLHLSISYFPHPWSQIFTMSTRVFLHYAARMRVFEKIHYCHLGLELHLNESEPIMVIPF